MNECIGKVLKWRKIIGFKGATNLYSFTLIEVKILKIYKFKGSPALRGLQIYIPLP